MAGGRRGRIITRGDEEPAAWGWPAAPLALEDWLTAVEADDQPGLHSFARGIRRDQQAANAGLALPCSSGALEGKNCKIKHLKRLIYGRANFDLLRKTALLN